MSSRKMEGMDQRKFILGELPLEIFEMVLNYVGNNNDLLSLRLVNSVWNSSVTSILQRRVLQRDKKWSPFITRSYSGYYKVRSPTLTIVRPESNRNRLRDNKLSLAFFPVGITKFQRGRNPFPTNSLRLSTRSYGVDNYDNRQRVSVYRLLQLHGHHLTSLWIGRSPFGLTPSEIFKVLQFVPNLKVLYLIGCTVRDPTEADQEGLSGSDFGPLVPKLTHAALCSISASFVRHLFKMFASQLIHLELDGYHPMQLFCLDYLSDCDKNNRSPLKNLKQLKVFHPTRDFLLLTEISLPLSLVRLSLFCPGIGVSIDELKGFIERFSSTLEDLGLILGGLPELQLCGDPENRVLPSFGKRSQVKSQFPRLSRFCINELDDPRLLQLVKNHLLPRFPNLKTLQLLDLLKEMVVYRRNKRTWDPETRRWSKIKMEGLSDEARRFCKQERLWEVCPKLKSIQIQYYDPCWNFREQEPRFDFCARRERNGGGEN